MNSNPNSDRFFDFLMQEMNVAKEAAKAAPMHTGWDATTILNWYGTWGLGGIGTENNAKAETIYPYGFQALNFGLSQAAKSL